MEAHTAHHLANYFNSKNEIIDLDPDDEGEPEPERPRNRTYGVPSGFRLGGNGGGGGDGPKKASYAQVNLMFPDLAQMAMVFAVLMVLYLAYRAYVVARGLAKFTKMLQKIENFANAFKEDGGLEALVDYLKLQAMEAENAGSRNNAEALYYRIRIMYKQSQDIQKQIWTVKKQTEGNSGGDGGKWSGGG